MPNMDNVSCTSTTRFETLESLNDSEMRSRLPAIVFQSVLIVVGISGNCMVWLIYGCKIRKQSTHKSLVLGIAFYDTLACCFGIPGNIVDLRYPYMFYSNVGCKLLRFGYHLLSAGSSTIHFLMGVDRYRRICVPLGNQLSNKLLVYLMVAAFLAVVIIATPTLVIYESVEVDTSVEGIVGWQCSQTDRTRHALTSLLYEILLGLLVIVCGSSLIVLYVQVGRTIYRRGTVVNSIAGHTIRKTSVSTTPLPIVDDLDRSVMDEHGEAEKDTDKRDTDTDENIGDIKREPSDEVQEANQELRTVKTDRDRADVLEIVRQMQIRKTSLRNAKSRRLTLITFILSLIFILSYFPVLFLTFLANFSPNSLQKMSFRETCTYFVFIVSYTLNNVSNPLVYLAMDDEYRKTIHSCLVAMYAWVRHLR